MSSIAHHALDWFASSEPWHIPRKTSRQLAAIALAIVKRFNEEESYHQYALVPLSNAELSQFGGWANVGAINSAALLGYNAVVGNVIERDLLRISLLQQKAPLASFHEGNDPSNDAYDRL